MSYAQVRQTTGARGGTLRRGMRQHVITVDEFKQRVRAASDEEIVRDVILSDNAAYVSEANQSHLGIRLAEAYGVSHTDLRLWIVGSAKLGYSISEKTLRDGTRLPRFRPFRVDSDIDVAVICRPIFEAIWWDLSRHANYAARMPWQSGQLGNYLVHGWLRPDLFPGGLRHCDHWWDQFRQFSREARFERRRVRGGLFYSSDDLVRYHSRSVSECRRALEVEL